MEKTRKYNVLKLSTKEICEIEGGSLLSKAIYYYFQPLVWAKGEVDDFVTGFQQGMNL